MFYVPGAPPLLSPPQSHAHIATHCVLDIAQTRASSWGTPGAPPPARISAVPVEPSDRMVDDRTQPPDVHPPVRIAGSARRLARISRHQPSPGGGERRDVHPPSSLAFWDVFPSRVHKDLCDMSLTKDLAERIRSYNKNALGIRALRRLSRCTTFVVGSCYPSARVARGETRPVGFQVL